MLASFGLAGAAAGVHEKQRCFSIHGNGSHDFTGVIGQDFVNPVIPAFHEGRSGGVLSGVPSPNEDFLQFVPFFGGNLERNVSGCFVIEQLAVAVIAVHRDQDIALGIGSAHATSLAAEAAKDDGVNHPKPRTCQHGDRQLGNHGHVNGDAISRLQTAEVAQ